MLTYDDLTDAQLDTLQAADQRYLNFLGHGREDAQTLADRVVHANLMTYSPSGKPCVNDEKAVDFLVAVTGLPREVCFTYNDA